jgi:membrane protein
VVDRATTESQETAPTSRPASGALGAVRSAWRWLVELYECIDRGRTFGLAAETAFWLFLSMVPLAAVAGLVAARLSLENWQELTPVISSMPWSTRQLVQTELVNVSRWNGGTVGLTGALAFAWAASSGLHALFEALETEAGVRRSWFHKRAMAIGTCVALSLVVALLALLGPGVEAAETFLGSRVRAFDVVSAAMSTQGRALRVALSLSIAFGNTCLLYRFGVPRTGRAVPIVPGALVAVALQAIVSVAYPFYVARFGGGEAAYGASLAIVALTLTALYLFVLSLLVGAVVNRRIGAPAEPCPPKGTAESEASGVQRAAP